MPRRGEAHRPPSSGNPYMRDLLTTGFLAIIIGALTGLVAVGVRVVIAFLTGLFFRGEITTEFVPPMFNDLGVLVVLVPAVGAGLSYLIVKTVSHEDRVRGTAEVVEIVTRRRGRVSPRNVIGHATATMVGVGAGGSAGRENAMVQLGAALGMIASVAYGSSVRHRKILIAAGASGAIAATFNTPIAGVIFAAEVVLIEWSTRTFIPLSIAAASSTMVSTRFLGTQPAFPIPAYELVNSSELFLYVGLGILAGAWSILTFRMLRLTDAGFQNLKAPAWTKPVAGGLLVGLVGLLVPQAFGVGYETVRLALDGVVAAPFLAVVLVAKLIAFALTRGSGGAGGAFSPSLFMGAALGGAFGEVVHGLFPTWTASSGAYALVGMAAVYAAVTRASLTAVVMLYEMTHTFSIIIPVMVAVVVADAMAKAYGETTLYRPSKSGTASSETDASVNILDVVASGEIMTRKVDTVQADAPVRQVLEQRFRTGHQGYPVLDEKKRLAGIITATDMRVKVKDGDLDHPIREFMTLDPVTVFPSTSAHEALTEMVRHDVGHLPVVSEDDGHELVGFLTRQDIIGCERRVLDEEVPGESVFERMHLSERLHLPSRHTHRASAKERGRDAERERERR